MEYNVSVERLDDKVVLTLPNGSQVNLPSDVSNDEIGEVLDQVVSKQEDPLRDVMVDSPKSVVSPDFDPASFGNVVRAGLEGGASLISGIASAGASYPAGLLTSALSDEEGSGIQTIKDIQEDYTYKPRTDAGKYAMSQLGKGVETVLGKDGLDILGLNQEMANQARDKYGAGEVLQTSWYALPDTLEALTGVRTARNIQGQIQLKRPDGSPTDILQKLLQEKGIQYELMSPEAQKLIPDSAPRSTILGKPEAPTDRSILEDIRSGGDQKGLAGYKEGRFGLEGDQLGKNALNLDIPSPLIQSVKQASGPTKLQMLMMVDDMKKIKGSDSATSFPSKRVGNVVGERVDYIIDNISASGQKLDSIANSRLADVPVDLNRIQGTFKSLLDDLGVTYQIDRKPNATTGEMFETPRFVAEGKPTFKFEGTDLDGNAAAQSIVNEAALILANAKKADALTLHKVKRRLDGLIDTKKTDGHYLSTEGKRFVQRIRKDINDQLRGIDSEYAQLNDKMSLGLQTLETLSDAVASRVKKQIKEGKGYDGLGAEMRKLFSNYGSAPDLFDSLKAIDDTVINYARPKKTEVAIYDPTKAGVKTPNLNTDIITLARFNERLNEVFGSSKATSFAGQTETGTMGALNQFNPSVTGRAAVDISLGAVDRLKGKSKRELYEQRQMDQFRALEALIRGGK